MIEHDIPAESIGRKAAKVARTAVIAVACFHIVSFNQPIWDLLRLGCHVAFGYWKEGYNIFTTLSKKVVAL
jgi:hypothetical protein